MVSPSIHQDGHPYEIIGTKDPCILTELQAQELIQHINQICIRNGVEYLTKIAGSGKLNTKLKQMCKKLVIDKSVTIDEGQRNDMLIAIADSILLRHSTRHSEEYLRELFEKINKQLCKPPLDGRELDSIWQRASNFTEKIKEEQKQADKTKRKTIYGIGDNSDYIPEEIHNEIGDDIYLKINDSPIILIVAQKKSGRIVLAKVNERSIGEGPSRLDTCYLSVKNTVIDAVPIRVVINESPIDGVKTYQITFSHKGAGRPFTVGPNTVKAIVAELQDRGRYIDKDADKFLTGILTRYEDNDLAEFNNQVLQSGYYLVDNKIVGYDITQNQNREIGQQEAKDCIYVIEGLLPKYRKKEIIPTVIKWGIVAPFSYVKKCHSLSGSNWLPALAPYGRKRTGKNTIGIIALAISRKHTVKDKPIHQIGVGSIDSPARLGKAISRTTYPVMSSEVDLANERLRWLVEMIKYAIESTTVRGRHVDKYHYEDIRALSNIIITSNHRPPKDDAFLTRIIPIHFSRKDDTTPEQKKEFEKWLFDEGRIDKLGVLGDFATKMIIDNPSVLLDNRWEDTAKLILKEFYEHAGCKDEEIPKWIDYILEEDVSGQADEETELELRAFLVNMINDAYSKYVRTLPLEQQNDAVDKAIRDTSIWSRLELCLKGKILPFLHEHYDRDSGYDGDTSIIITSDVMGVLKKYDMRNIVTLKDIADELDFEYKRVKLGGKTVWAVKTARQKFVALLDGKLETINDDDQNEEGNN